MRQSFRLRFKRYWTSVIGLAACMPIAGCSTVDSFGPRAVAYNRQLAGERREVIIDDIIRSARGDLLQFSEVSTITGQLSGQIGLAGVLPILGSPQGTGRLFNVNPTTQIAGGPSFTVANLNTQDFYSGITAPIKPEIIANYAGLGYPREVLFPLVVSSIAIRQGNKNYIFKNDSSSIEDYEGFSALLQLLINAGLTFETNVEQSFVGPPLREEDLRRPGVLGIMLQADTSSKRSVASYSLADAADQLSVADRAEMKAKGETVFYRIREEKQALRYCFSSREEVSPQKPRVISGAIIALPPLNIDGRVTRLSLPAELRCSDETVRPRRDEAASSFVVTSRSVHGIFDYLGTMVRTELKEGDPAKFDVATAAGPIRLFGLERVAGGKVDSKLADGSYRIVRLGDGHDGSDRTVQLLSELIALYSSTKSFPAPNLITTTGR